MDLKARAVELLKSGKNEAEVAKLLALEMDGLVQAEGEKDDEFEKRILDKYAKQREVLQKLADIVKSQSKYMTIKVGERSPKDHPYADVYFDISSLNDPFVSTGKVGVDWSEAIDTEKLFSLLKEEAKKLGYELDSNNNGSVIYVNAVKEATK